MAFKEVLVIKYNGIVSALRAPSFKMVVLLITLSTTEQRSRVLISSEVWGDEQAWAKLVS